MLNMETSLRLSILQGPRRPRKQGPLHKLFEDICKEVPNEQAIIFEDSNKVIKHTYQELNELSNKIANHLLDILKTKHLQKKSEGDIIVAVCMLPSDKLVAVLLGIWKAGAAYLPMDPTFSDTRIEQILNEAKPVITIYEKNRDIFQLTHGLSMKEVEDALENIDGGNLKNECVQNVAIVLYTSGSAGVPKGVRLPHDVILNRLQWQFCTFPYSKSEIVGVFKTVFTFVDSIPEIWGPLINGLSVLIIPKSTTKNPEKLVDVLELYKIERLVLVPTLLKSILMFLELNRDEKALENLKIWVCSGETLSVSLSEEFFKYFSDEQHLLCNFYGSTEIMGDVSYHILKNASDLKFMEKVPIGVPIDNSILYILDKDLRLTNENVIGELYVAGGNIAAGYVNGRDPEKFIQNPLSEDPAFGTLFKTGDFAKLSNGVLVYEGRTDLQVKVRGHRVDLTEIEKALAGIPTIDKCVVICYKPGETNQDLLGFVTTSSLMSENQIEHLLVSKLPSYMLPQVIIVETIPFLVSGKIDRQALLESYENINNNVVDGFQAEIDFSGVPSSKLEAAKVLFETVALVLGRSARAVIEIKSNFYEIGGNSLNSIFTISTLNDKGYHVRIGDFIAANNLGEVLEKMLQDNIMVSDQPSIYRSELFREDHKVVIIDMIVSSFYNKKGCCCWLMSGIGENDYKDLINNIWDKLVDEEVSFVAISKETNQIIGCAINFDAHEEPEVGTTSNLGVIFDFLETIEGPVRDNQLPVGKGKVLHSSMMATHPSLTGRENVSIMQFMEDEVLKLARKREFMGILTTNTSPLTQQLGSSVNGYRTMYDCQVNQYVASDNSRPFGLAPDSQRAIVHWKRI